MRRSNFALRLQTSLLEEARNLAKAKGMSLNRLFNMAVAEKLSALRAGDDLRRATPTEGEERPNA